MQELPALCNLARIAGLRWTVESDFEPAKSEVDSFIGRRRHITPVMLAHAPVAVLRTQHRYRPSLLPAKECGALTESGRIHGWPK